MSKHRETDSGFYTQAVEAYTTVHKAHSLGSDYRRTIDGIYLKVQELERAALRAVDKLKDELEEERRKSASRSAYALGFKDGKTEAVRDAAAEGRAYEKGFSDGQDSIRTALRNLITQGGPL